MSAPRTPAPVSVSCPVCGEAVQVFVVVRSAARSKGGLSGNVGWLDVEFEDGHARHECGRMDS
jgi:hypothetical protein